MKLEELLPLKVYPFTLRYRDTPLGKGDYADMKIFYQCSICLLGPHLHGQGMDGRLSVLRPV